jgi:hypothetical protein
MRDTIELAREAQMPYFWQSGEIAHLEQLKRFEALARADEREACAKVCEQMPTHVDRHNAVTQASAKDCAAAIRARGETK